MDLILNNLKTNAVILDYCRLDPSSYQMEDYTLVIDKRPLDYEIDDVGDQNDPRIAPINHDFLDMDLRRPFCTPGVFNMSLEEFVENNLYCMSHWYIGSNRFALTSTVNTTTHSARVTNDKEWLAQRASHSEFVRLDTPRYFKRKTPQLYRQGPR